VYGLQSLEGARVVFKVEAELDALLLRQLMPGVACLALPANQPLRDDTIALIGDRLLIIADDCDEHGAESAQMHIATIPGAHLAPPLPAGKDLTECAGLLGASVAINWIAEAIASAENERNAGEDF